MIKPQHLICPSCHEKAIRLEDYESMMVLREDTALFTLICPQCKTRVSLVSRIPENLSDDVLFAAIELDAGMGRES